MHPRIETRTSIRIGTPTTWALDEDTPIRCTSRSPSPKRLVEAANREETASRGLIGTIIGVLISTADRVDETVLPDAEGLTTDGFSTDFTRLSQPALAALAIPRLLGQPNVALAELTTPRCRTACLAIKDKRETA